MTVETDPTTVHRVEFFLDIDSVYADITCDGDRESRCHQSCGHEEGCTCTALRKYDECLIVDWITSYGTVAEFYDGEPQAAKDGIVDVEWDGENWVWWFKGQPRRTS